MIRAVIDTNILVRAMLKPNGSVGPVVDLLRDGRYVCLYSEVAALGAELPASENVDPNSGR